MKLYKKLLLIPFSLLITLIIVNFCDDIFNDTFTDYIQSLSILGLGIVIYPFNFKFKYKIDYIFLIVKAVAVINLLNLIVFQDFSFKTNYINIFTGIFGILLSFSRLILYNIDANAPRSTANKL